MVAYKRLKTMENHLTKVVAVTYRRCLFTRGSDFKALTQKVLVFWIGSC